MHIRNLILAFFFLSYSEISFAQEEKNILFVGNSLTFYNQMPQMLQGMLNEKKIKIKVDQITPGGWTLAIHATYVTDTTGNKWRANRDEIPTTVKKILSKKWEAVVLQEATLAALIPREFEDCTEPSLIFLDSIIRSIHSKTIIYQAFSSEHFPIKYSHIYSGTQMIIYNLEVFKPKERPEIPDHNMVFCTDSFRNTSEEYDAIKAVYNKLAAKTGADIAEVGYAYEVCKKLYPEVQLYGEDGAHPSSVGSYLIACVFFKKLTKASLKDIKYHGSIDAAIAGKMRLLVESYM